MEALGILQLWVWCAGEINLGATWSPLLGIVATYKPACEAVVTYLLSFLDKKSENSELLRVVLEENVGFITPSTLWVMM